MRRCSRPGKWVAVRGDQNPEKRWWYFSLVINRVSWDVGGNSSIQIVGVSVKTNSLRLHRRAFDHLTSWCVYTFSVFFFLFYVITRYFFNYYFFRSYLLIFIGTNIADWHISLRMGHGRLLQIAVFNLERNELYVGKTSKKRSKKRKKKKKNLHPHQIVTLSLCILIKTESLIRNDLFYSASECVCCFGDFSAIGQDFFVWK